MMTRDFAHQLRSLLFLFIAMTCLAGGSLAPAQEPAAPSRESPLLAEARDHRDSGRFEQAIAAYTRYILENPQAWQARSELAQVFITRRDLDAAELQLQQAIMVERERADLWGRLGQVYLLKEDEEHAELALTRARKYDPNDPTVRYNLGKLYHKQARDDEAFDEYLAFLEAAPDDPKAAQIRVRMALFYETMNLPEEAIEQLKILVEENPDDPRYHQKLADMHFKVGKGDEALAEYRKVIELAPDNADAHYNIGFILKHKVELDEAEEHLLFFVEHNPDSVIGNFTLATVQFENGKHEASAVSFQKTVELEPEHPQAHYYYSRALMKLGRRDEARRHMEIHRELEKKRQEERPSKTMEGS